MRKFTLKISHFSFSLWKKVMFVFQRKETGTGSVFTTTVLWKGHWPQRESIQIVFLLQCVNSYIIFRIFWIEGMVWLPLWKPLGLSAPCCRLCRDFMESCLGLIGLLQSALALNAILLNQTYRIKWLIINCDAHKIIYNMHFPRSMEVH